MTLGKYNILHGKTISWIVENCEYVEKFNLDEISKDDIIIYCGELLDNIRSYGIMDWRGSSMEMKREKFKKWLMQILEDYDEDTSSPLISFFTDFVQDEYQKSKETVSYYMLKPKLFSGSSTYWELQKDNTQDIIGAIFKIRKREEYRRHKGGVSFHQLNETFLIRNTSQSNYINWTLRNPMEVKE